MGIRARNSKKKRYPKGGIAGEIDPTAPLPAGAPSGNTALTSEHTPTLGTRVSNFKP